MTPACTPSAVPLDHVILYGGFEMDTLFDFFERAGFLLTPLSRHSLGTVNRLAMLEDQYIELIGFLPGTPSTVRPELQAMPLGLNGVAAADGAGHARGRHDGFAAPMVLERPVDTSQARGVARFTITHMQQPVTDARVFLCRHHTPQLVWMTDWMRHANGAAGVAEVRIPSAEPARLAALVDAVFDVPAEAGRNCWRAGPSTVRVAPASEAGALVVRVNALDTALRAVREGGLDHTLEAGALRLPLPARFRCELVLKAA